jgi:CAP-Gly domain-containing linker protein 1
VQETIALYEERLSASDTQRYELEDKVAELEEKLKGLQVAPNSPSSQPSTTTMIDNETLRDQVVHLQKKIGTLEDMIEDSRATAEKEEAAMRDKLKRHKDREDQLKKELGESKKEVERILKSEALARGRVEEVQVALKESTTALEDAQAEIEGLRAELDVLLFLRYSPCTDTLHTEYGIQQYLWRSLGRHS